MMETVNFLSDDFNLTTSHFWFSSVFVSSNRLSRTSRYEPRTPKYRINWEIYIYLAISTFVVQICYTNKFLLYSNKLFSLRINFPGTLYLCTAEGADKYETGTNVKRTTKKTHLTTFMKDEEWRLFLSFLFKSDKFSDFMTLQDKHNIRTLSLNIKFICTRCETGLKGSPKARYSACF
jgi:hypothetical protein